MKQARPRCLLHIGCMKTGTTSLQRFLGENKPALLTQGILHPESLRRPGRYNHSGLVAFALDEDHEADVRRRFGLVDGATTQRFRLALQTEFAREMDQCPEHVRTVVCLSEHLSHLLRSEAEIVRLKALLEPHFSRVDVVVYLRRQDRLQASLYSTALRKGACQQTVLGGDEPALQFQQEGLDYHHLLQRWSRVFGREALHVRVYDDCKHHLLEDFAGLAGISLEPGLCLPPPANTSLSAVGQEILLRINTNGLFTEPERRVLVSLLNKHHAGPPRLPARREAQLFLARFSDSNARARLEFLPARASPLFDDDFTAYPEHEERHAPEVDAVLPLLPALMRKHPTAQVTSNKSPGFTREHVQPVGFLSKFARKLESLVRSGS